MAASTEDAADDGDTSNMQTTLGIVAAAYLFKIPPKASAMGHMADTWPKKAMWVGRLKILSTATECTLQFENPDTDKVYLKVLINNDPEKPSTVEPAADSSRYFALNITKPGTDQIFELGLGFQTRDEAMDFKMATGEFHRMKQNLEEAKKFNMQVKEDFSLAADEVLVMKPMAKKKKNKDESKDNGGDPFDLGGPPGDLAPPKSKKKKKKKKKKGSVNNDDKKEIQKEDNNDNDNNNNDNLFDDNFGDFAQADNAGGAGGDDGSWATFD